MTELILGHPYFTVGGAWLVAMVFICIINAGVDR